MRWMCLLIGLSFLLFAPAWAGHTPPKILLRIYIQTTGEGLPDAQATRVAIPPNGEIIQIRSLPEVTERELISVQQDTTSAVHLQFNHEGQVVLDAATAQNQNRIMVVMLNGFVIYAPTIDEQITTGELIIPHRLKPEVLQLLQETARKNVQEQSHN